MPIIALDRFATARRKSLGDSTPRSTKPFAMSAAARGLKEVCNTRVISASASSSESTSAFFVSMASGVITR